MTCNAKTGFIVRTEMCLLILYMFYTVRPSLSLLVAPSLLLVSRYIFGEAKRAVMCFVTFLLSRRATARVIVPVSEKELKDISSFFNDLCQENRRTKTDEILAFRGTCTVANVRHPVPQRVLLHFGKRESTRILAWLE